MKKILYILFLLPLAISCNDLVDVVPKGKSIPTTVDDLAYLMNASSRKSSNVAVSIHGPELMTDDCELAESGGPMNFEALNQSGKNRYIWAPYIFTSNEVDGDWSNMYNSNYVVNYVIREVGNMKEGVVYTRNEVEGRARVHRAMNYFLLANLYAKQYDPATAAADPGVPLVTDIEFKGNYPRSTVGQVYKFIVDDLTAAIPLLERPADEFAHIPGKAAAYSLLARVNLFMGDYDEAYKNADEALKLKSALVDYNGIKLLDPETALFGIEGYEPEMVANPETMYYRFRVAAPDLPMSGDMSSQYDRDNDLRFRYMMADLAIFGMEGYLLCNYVHHSGIMTAEVWLTKAEAALRKSASDPAAAREALNHLRKHRMDKATYEPVTENDSQRLLQLILDERRRETRMSVLRWFDLRRLNRDAATAKTFSHTGGGVTYTLTPESPLYVLPIPLNVMQFDDTLTQNPAPGRD